MIAIRRIIKRFIYAALFFVLLALLVTVVILPNFNLFRRNPTPPPPVRESIVIESVDTIIHEDTIDLIARVRNPNPRAGVPDYTITFILLDSAGQTIEEIPTPTYLLPGSLKYVVALDVPLTEPVDKVRVEQSTDPVFAAVDIASTIPSFSSFLRERAIKNFGHQPVEIQTGLVTNTGNLGYRHVDITAIAYDAANQVVGVGRTFIGEFQAGEQREFTLQWPQPFSATAKVIVLPDTNIYREDNILSVSGNPGRLRDQLAVPTE